MPKPITTESTFLPKSVINALPASLEIMEHLQAVAKLVPMLAKQMAKAHQSGAVPMARAFVALHRLDKRHDELLKPITTLLEEYKKDKLPALFEQSGVSTLNLEEGFRITASSKFYASIKKDNIKEAYDWLRKNNLGDLIVETVNAQTLSAAGKILRDDKNSELPPDFFTTADVPSTSVTATK